jgi:hypothetical protein
VEPGWGLLRACQSPIPVPRSLLLRLFVRRVLAAGVAEL